MEKEDSDDDNEEVAMGVSSMKTGSTTVSANSSYSTFSGQILQIRGDYEEIMFYDPSGGRTFIRPPEGS